MQTQSSADRSTTSLSLAHQRKNKQKLSTNLTLYKAYTNLRRAETKRNKEFNLLQGKNSTFLEAWEKETTNTIISRLDYHLTEPCPSEEKQTNKNSAQISSYTKLTQTTGPTLGGQKPKGKKNSTFFRKEFNFP